MQLQQLLQQLESGSPDARIRAAEELGDSKEPQAVESLIAALQDEDRDVQTAVVSALVCVGDVRAVQPLLELEAVRELAHFGDAGAEPLLTLLRGKNPWLRAEAAEGLGKIGDICAVDSLQLALRDKDSSVREKAAKALQSLGWHPANNTDRAYLAVVQLEWDEAIRLGEDSLDPLVVALEHPDASVRCKAAEALGRIDDMRAVEPLLELSQQDRDTHVYGAATEALISLDRSLKLTHKEGRRTEVNKNTQKRFPLDVLLISGHMHRGASTSYGLHKYLSHSPAVRSYGITTLEPEAMAYIRAGAVNTVFVNPCFPSEWFWDVEPFIARVREEHPIVVFILYTDENCLESFCKVYPRFRHYFYLPEIWGFQEDDGEFPLESVVDAMLRRCEEWHRTRYEYDVAISFAGEDRPVAKELAAQLQRNGRRVFYDGYEEADLLGKNLYTHLHEIYSVKSRYCTILVSEAYATKIWTSHERVAAQERALNERGREYILPIRLDDTPLQGLSSTIGYVSIERGIEHIADLIDQKLWLRGAEQKRYIGDTLY